MFCKHGFYGCQCDKMAKKHGLDYTPCFFEDPEKCDEFEENRVGESE